MTPTQQDNLRRLLAPRSVAFIGGNDAAFAAKLCADAGFDGDIWGVNPGRETLGGAPCFASIDSLPGIPDACFLAVPRVAAVASVAALSKLGAGGAVCYTAGFSELGEVGRHLETQLSAAAGDLALVGPNSYGLLNFVRSVPLWPYGYPMASVPRGVAIVSQSGMLGSNLVMNQRSLPFSYVISVGNQAVLGAEDYLEVLLDDEAVSAVGLYLEGLRDIPRFADIAARALRAGMPIVALKAGRSAIAAQLTVTHTGSLSGTDALYDALFKRLGIIRVDSPVNLLETLKLLHVAGPPRGRRIAAFTFSGGDAAMLADVGEAYGLEFPQPSPRARALLAKRLPDIATISNPQDLTTPIWGDTERLPPAFRAMFVDDFDAAMFVQDYPQPGVGIDPQFYLNDARSFMAETREIGIPAAVCSSLPENLDAQTRAMLINGGVAPLQGIEEAIAAIAGAATHSERRSQIMANAGWDRLGLKPVSTSTEPGKVLDEWESKRLLTSAGIIVPHGRLSDAAGAAAAAADIGFPVVVKMVSPDLPHKTEAGAIRMGLNSRDAVREAVADIRSSVNRYHPEAHRDHYLIEAQTSEALAELLIGIRADPAFGQVLVLASGGILVELLNDSATLLLPSSQADVLRALQSLRIYPLMCGYRGRPAADQQLVIKTITRVMNFAATHRDDLVELDINPLMVLPDAVVAVDAVLRIRARSLYGAGSRPKGKP